MKLSEELLKGDIDCLSDPEKIQYQNKRIYALMHYNILDRSSDFMNLSSIILVTSSVVLALFIRSKWISLFLMFMGLVCVIWGLVYTCRALASSSNHNEEIEDWLRERIE